MDENSTDLYAQVEHITYSNGSVKEEWRLNGKLHNEDGPAEVFHFMNGRQSSLYYLGGHYIAGGREEFLSLKNQPEDVKIMNMLRTGNVYGLLS